MFRPKQDNVLLALESLSATTAGGIVVPGFEYKTGPDGAEGKRKRDFDPRRKRAQLRRARVLAVGPGHHPGCTKCGGSHPTLIPTTLRPGDIVWIDAVAGDDWSLDRSAPRHHTKPLNFEQVGDHVGELRIVREEECQLFETDDLPDTQRDPSAEAPERDYEVFNHKGGRIPGVYRATTQYGALEAMARSAGYIDYAQAQRDGVWATACPVGTRQDTQRYEKGDAPLGPCGKTKDVSDYGSW